MTYRNVFTPSEALLQQLSTSGLAALTTLFQGLLHAARQIERQKHLGVASLERNNERNGYKDETFSTRKAAAITEQALDETLAVWRSRPLCSCLYVYLDARYERVRQAGKAYSGKAYLTFSQ